MVDVIPLRSRKAQKKITNGDRELDIILSQLLSSPIDPSILAVYAERQGSFGIQKRLIQEQCAHFILRHLARNNIQLGEEGQIRNILGLSGNDPDLAMLSYMGRGLGDHVDLYEKLWTVSLGAKRKEVQASKLWTEAAVAFWRGRKEKTCSVHFGNYLTGTKKDTYVGFLLDHCGCLPPTEKIIELLMKHSPKKGAFFLETTALDGRGSNPHKQAIEIDLALINNGVLIRAKDSYEYKGWTEHTCKGYGAPMTVHVWVLERC